MNAGAGNFNVNQGSPAKNIGFNNFSVNEFGVQSKRLRNAAGKPPVPVLRTALINKRGKVNRWIGTTLKNIETQGEQSACGLPDKNGMLLLRVSGGKRPLSPFSRKNI
ncbi:MAG: hypothetical protein ABIY90_14940 [Puia sp.]